MVQGGSTLGAGVIEADHTAVWRCAGTRSREGSRSFARGLVTRPIGRRALAIQSRACFVRCRLVLASSSIGTIGRASWDGAIAARLASESVADWLRTAKASRAVATGYAACVACCWPIPGSSRCSPRRRVRRLRGCAGRRRAGCGEGTIGSPPAMAGQLRAAFASARSSADSAVGRLVATLEQRGKIAELRADFLVSASPATRRCASASSIRRFRKCGGGPSTTSNTAMRPPSGAGRRFWVLARSAERLRVGPVVRRALGRRAQRGRAGILRFSGRGTRIVELQTALADGVAGGVHGGSLARLAWPGAGLSCHHVGARQWALGGTPTSIPVSIHSGAMRCARPHGRVVFAGEHTSIRWQGT
jgi:hypothetical protein